MTAIPTTAAPTTATATTTVVRYCGRDFTGDEMEVIRALTSALPLRAHIAKATCAQLGWYRHDGGLKEMSARVALNRMAADGLITLPPPSTTNRNGHLPSYRTEQGLLFEPEPINAPLATLGPLHPRQVTTRTQAATYRQLIATHHYLGYTPMPGAQLRYLIEAEHAGIVAAISFAASAWKCAGRDTHLGWDPATRQTNLHLIVGNARFLILPHIHVPHLASAILGRITRRLPTDWANTYQYKPVLVETFVETGRFTGTSYRAANWIHVGQTQGRGKLDRQHTNAVPVKDIYLYPLHRHYRTILNNPT